MHDGKVSFLEKYRSKHAPPPKTASPPKERIIGAPPPYVVDVCRLTEGRATLIVALCIFRRTKVCRNLTVTLPLHDLAKYGVDRRRKREALLQLQAAGLVQTYNKPGRTAWITLLWKNP